MSQLVMGWSAPPMKEQFPCLDEKTALAFDEDNQALIRLVCRGLITVAERDKARKRHIKAVEAALAQAMGEL